MYQMAMSHLDIIHAPLLRIVYICFQHNELMSVLYQNKHHYRSQSDYCITKALIVVYTLAIKTVGSLHILWGSRAKE